MPWVFTSQNFSKRVTSCATRSLPTARRDDQAPHQREQLKQILPFLRTLLLLIVVKQRTRKSQEFLIVSTEMSIFVGSSTSILALKMLHLRFVMEEYLLTSARPRTCNAKEKNIPASGLLVLFVEFPSQIQRLLLHKLQEGCVLLANNSKKNEVVSYAFKLFAKRVSCPYS